MFNEIKETFIRWRTWIVNVLFGVIISPEIILAISGFDWGTIIPPEYLPFITLAVLVINIWMRPRPAVLPTDPEVKIKERLENV